PESNHLLTVRGATLQILATSPVVRTSFSFEALICITLPPAALGERAANRPGLQPGPGHRAMRNTAGTVYIDVWKPRFSGGVQHLPVCPKDWNKPKCRTWGPRSDNGADGRQKDRAHRCVAHAASRSTPIRSPQRSFRYDSTVTASRDSLG